MDLTATQIAAICNVSERTVQRWIRDKRLNVQALPNGRYRVSEADIEAVRPPDVVTLVERIEALETDVRVLRTELDELRQEQARQPPPTRVRRPAPAQDTAVPGDLVTARNFAERHHVNRKHMARLIEAKAFETTPVPHGDKPLPKLTQDQQRAVIAYWQASGIPYTPCPDCPHEM